MDDKFESVMCKLFLFKSEYDINVDKHDNKSDEIVVLIMNAFLFFCLDRVRDFSNVLFQYWVE